MQTAFFAPHEIPFDEVMLAAACGWHPAVHEQVPICLWLPNRIVSHGIDFAGQSCHICCSLGSP